MKCQQPAFVRKRIILVHPEYLAGSKKYHRSIGIIIIFPPATVASPFTILYQQDSIELKLHGILIHIRIFQINNAYLGMQRFASQTPVTLTYSLYVQCIVFHHL